jgi:hypothetical protein
MKKLFKIFSKDICLTSRKSIMFIIGILISGAVIASMMLPEEEADIVIENKESKTESDVWIPTEEDIQYQDSMFQIIQQTQFEVDTIKQDIDKILYKLERLEYADGTWDSIRIRR